MTCVCIRKKVDGNERKRVDGYLVEMKERDGDVVENVVKKSNRIGGDSVSFVLFR